MKVLHSAPVPFPCSAARRRGGLCCPHSQVQCMRTDHSTKEMHLWPNGWCADQLEFVFFFFDKTVNCHITNNFNAIVISFLRHMTKFPGHHLDDNDTSGKATWMLLPLCVMYIHTYICSCVYTEQSSLSIAIDVQIMRVAIST